MHCNCNDYVNAGADNNRCVEKNEVKEQRERERKLNGCLKMVLMRHTWKMFFEENCNCCCFVK